MGSFSRKEALAEAITDLYTAPVDNEALATIRRSTSKTRSEEQHYDPTVEFLIRLPYFLELTLKYYDDTLSAQNFKAILAEKGISKESIERLASTDKDIDKKRQVNFHCAFQEIPALWRTADSGASGHKIQFKTEQAYRNSHNMMQMLQDAEDYLKCLVDYHKTAIRRGLKADPAELEEVVKKTTKSTKKVTKWKDAEAYRVRQRNAFVTYQKVIKGIEAVRPALERFYSALGQIVRNPPGNDELSR